MDRKKLSILTQVLKTNGFYVRKHAYEYVIGYKGRILGVMEIFNLNNFIFHFNSVAKEEFWKVFGKLVNVLHSFDKNAKVVAKLCS